MNRALSTPERTALFFDFDGTLVDFAETPDAVHVPQSARDILLTCVERTAGATAIITGRNLQSLDGLLQMPQLPASGSHGAEWRRVPYGEIGVDKDNMLPEEVTMLCRAFCQSHGLIFENKVFSVAIHFRQSPEVEGELDRWLHENFDSSPDLTVQFGKQVREIKSVTFDKGTAVARFMESAQFCGRTPWFFGDDVTDEAAMKWVNANGGVSIKVGEGDTCAQFRLKDPRHLHEYLTQHLAARS